MQATCRNICDSLAAHSAALKPALFFSTYLLRLSIMQLLLPTQFLARYVCKRPLSKKFEHLSSSITERVHTVVMSLEAAMIPASKMAFLELSAMGVI